MKLCTSILFRFASVTALVLVIQPVWGEQTPAAPPARTAGPPATANVVQLLSVEMAYEDGEARAESLILRERAQLLKSRIAEMENQSKRGGYTRSYQEQLSKLRRSYSTLSRNADRLERDAVAIRQVLRCWDGQAVVVLQTARDLSSQLRRIQVGEFVKLKGKPDAIARVAKTTAPAGFPPAPMTTPSPQGPIGVLVSAEVLPVRSSQRSEAQRLDDEASAKDRAAGNDRRNRKVLLLEAERLHAEARRLLIDAYVRRHRVTVEVAGETVVLLTQQDCSRELRKMTAGDPISWTGAELGEEQQGMTTYSVARVKPAQP